MAELMRVTGKLEELLRLAVEAEERSLLSPNDGQSSSSSTLVTQSGMLIHPKSVGCA